MNSAKSRLSKTTQHLFIKGPLVTQTTSKPIAAPTLGVANQSIKGAENVGTAQSSFRGVPTMKPFDQIMSSSKLAQPGKSGMSLNNYEATR